MEDQGTVPQKWETLTEKCIAACKVYDVYQSQCRHPSGREGLFYTLRASDWVHVLALTRQEEILLVEQYRFGSQTLSLEIPGGLIDLGESPADSGARELVEETGFEGSEPLTVGTSRSNPGLLNNHSHYILITDCQKTRATDWDCNEELRTHVVPLEEAYRMVHAGRIEHGITLAGLLYLDLYRKKTVC